MGLVLRATLLLRGFAMWKGAGQRLVGDCDSLPEIGVWACSKSGRPGKRFSHWVEALSPLHPKNRVEPGVGNRLSQGIAAWLPISVLGLD